MKWLLIPVLVVLMAFVVITLVRGIAAFLASTRSELDRDPTEGPTALQLRQNRMMFARIKYQALAILVVALLLVLAH